MTQPQPFKLIIEDDEGRRSIVPVDLGDVSLGRHEGNVIRLKERNVSRKHARLAVEDDGRVFVYDLDSYNGLWANGDRINGRFELHQGDLLRIGDFQLELKGDSLKPRREEATQRTRVQDVQGTPASHTEPEFTPPEPTQVDADVPPAPPTKPIGDVPMAIEPTVPALKVAPKAPPEQGPSLHAIMQEATALIRNPMTGEAQQEEPAIDAALQPPFAKLLCLTTQLAGQEFLIDHGETVIGRTEDNEIAIDHRSISRHHAKILVSEKRYRLIDLDSANGTLVNGEVYAQAELKRGDILELGHIRLRFVPPGETASWTVDERNQLARMEAQRRKRGQLWRNSPLLMFLLVGSGIVGLGLAFTTMRAPKAPLPNANIRAAQGPAAVSEGQTPSPNREATERLLVAARHAVAAHQFKKAESLAQEIVGMDPGCDEAQAMLHLCAMEKKSQAAIDTANQAAQGSHWSDAYNALQDIAKESVVYHAGQTLFGQIRPGLIDERLVDCKQAIQKEDWDEAELLIEELTTLDPTRSELSELKASVRDGRAKHPTSGHGARNSASSSSSRSRKDSANSKDKDGIKASSSGASRAPQGALGTPATALAPTSTQPPATSAAAASPAASRPAPGRDPKSMYAEGTKLLAAKQYSRAIEEFQKCVSADKNFAMCYRALGIAYADANNGAEAVRYYRLYLKVDPSARDAAQVRTLLQQWDQSQAAQGQQAP